MDPNALSCTKDAVLTCGPAWKPGTGEKAKTCIRDLTCGVNQYDPGSGTTCTPCARGDNVFACSATEVTACANGRRISDDKLLCVCDDDKYGTATECKLCSGTFKHATKCSTSAALDCENGWIAQDGVCKRPIPCTNGLFDDDKSPTCTPCRLKHPNAVQCTLTAVTECEAGWRPDGNTCTRNVVCGPSEWDKGSGPSCTPCSVDYGDYVNGCNGWGIDSCITNFVKSSPWRDARCVCPYQTYLSTNNNNQPYCKPCSDFDPFATKCTAAAGATECPGTLKLIPGQNGKQVCGCTNANEYMDGTTCKSCPESFPHATLCSKTAVTKCEDFWKPADDQTQPSCVRDLSCPEGSMDPGSGGQCITCKDKFNSDTVATCSLDEGIQTCKGSYTLTGTKDDGDQACGCQDSEYDLDGTCTTCSNIDPRATKCEDANTVTDCSSNYLIRYNDQSKKYLCGCSSSSYDDGASCQTCQSRVDKATACTKDKVTACSSGYKPDSEGKQCVAVACTSSQYGSPSSATGCRACPSNATCDGTSFTCKTNYVPNKLGTGCVNTVCSGTQIFSQSALACKACPMYATCANSKIQSCADGHVLTQDKEYCACDGAGGGCQR
ncbi:hypothetical protein ACM66B_003326 [Microbotryomycetes sp. NB124-2]